MTERKTTTGTAKKAPSAAKKTTTPRAPRKTQQWIRNLRGTVVHLRLYSQSPKDPYRIELAPRGYQGEITSVPVKLVDDPTLAQAVGVLIEFITETEAKQLQYQAGPVGYLGRGDEVTVVRPEDSTVATAADWDGKGRRPQDTLRDARGREVPVRQVGTGQHFVDVPGSDPAMAAAARAGASAMPDGVDIASRRVVIEQ